MYSKDYLIGCVICFSLAVFVSGCSDRSRSIKMKGSDTEVNLAANLAEEFAKTNEDFSIAISGGGSGLGIAALLNGQADIANSSRPLTDEEIHLFEKSNIQLKTVVFAEDATAFVVNEDNPLNEISIRDLANLLDGTTSSWSEMVEMSSPVNIYGRQSSSGTYSFVKKKLKIEFSPSAKEMTGNAQILEGVKIDKSGIGYVGAGYIAKEEGSHQGIKVLKIKQEEGAEAVSPLDAHAIKNSLYYFQRPLYQFIPVESWEKVKTFIQFEREGKGRELIQNSGYFILN